MIDLRRGDCLEVMATLPDRSVDAVVTDPPYALEFMGKAWDRHASPLAFQQWCQAWGAECLRVLKPGGHLLSFGGTRTYHRLAAGLEDAGFEIRDCLAWMFGSGFPKSLDVSKAIDARAGAEREVLDSYERSGRSGGILGTETQITRDVTAPATEDAKRWEGWGTALKPAFEPVVLARKPLVGTVAGNVLAHGTGALNIDATRIGTDELAAHGGGVSGDRIYGMGEGLPPLEAGANPHVGRWPANVLLDEDAAAMLDAQTGTLHSQDPATRRSGSQAIGVTEMGTGSSVEYADTGGASRFFYCAKTSRAERNAGLDGFDQRETHRYGSGIGGSETSRHVGSPDRNVHPTVKPIELMRWLIRLVTPPGGTVLDPFLGSGTTGIAATLENRPFIGIEREAEYMEIAKARIGLWEQHGEDAIGIVKAADEADAKRREMRDAGQLDIFAGLE